MDRDLDVDHHDGAHGEPHLRSYLGEDAQHHNHRQPGLASPPQLDTQSDAHHGAANDSSQPYARLALDSPDTDGANHAQTLVNPDDFYKSFRALHFDDRPETLPMASSSVPRPSLRSNGNGSTPRHPVMPSGRNAPRFTARSVSSPLETKLPGTATRPSPTGRPSVRDMANRFDQVNNTSSIPRATISSRPKREPATDPRSRNGAQTYASLRSAGAQDEADLYTGSATSPRHNRSRTVAEDHVSNNPQSFASRVSKPRASVSGNSNASRSMTHLVQKSPTEPSSVPAVPSTQPLLFGEILPDQRDAITAGFGINDIRPRRTSDSNLRGSALHQRSLSNPDIEPASPSTWYRSLNGLQESAISDLPTPTKSHVRSQSHSEIPNHNGGPRGSPMAHGSAVAAAAAIPAPSVSKLPVSVRNVHSPSSSSPSTRSNSPALKRPTKANGKIPSSTSSTARATASRAKTPTQTSGGRRLPVPRPITPGNTNNARLNAYIANPQPKLSPTLRSSRPRQPVSEATTASSRMRAADRAKSPSAAFARAAAKATEPTQRRRKISLGPIDFAQRREHIKLAYSKSVRESQALEARQQAAERRRKDMEAAASAKARAEAVALASALPPDALNHQDLDLLSASETEATPIEEKPPPESLAPTEPSLESAEETGADPPITFGLQQLQGTGHAIHTPIEESPTLGVPGSFPMLSPPATQEPRPESAGSANTITTEFDTEPQIAPAVQNDLQIDIPITVVKSPSPQKPSPSPRAEYQYPFTDEPDTPEHQLPPTFSGLNGHSQRASYESNQELMIPGAFGDELNDSPDATSPYEATVMIMPPMHDFAQDTARNESIPFPRLDSYEESECQTDLDERGAAPRSADDLEGANTDACTEDSDLDEKTTDCRADSRLGDSICESSDADSPNPEADYDSASSRNNVSGTLQVPSSSKAMDRTSQQSTWTDFSIDSVGYSDSSRSPALQEQESPVYGHATIFESSPRPAQEPATFSQLPWSSSDIRPSYDSTRSSAVLSQSELPELDTGERFSMPYMSEPMSRADTQDTTASSPYYIPRPEHEPPPVPPSGSTSAVGSRRTSGLAFDPSQTGSALTGSTRPSIDYVNILETPQTIDSLSGETSDTYFGSQAPSIESAAPKASSDSTTSSDKERHRLAQRRNVIKELIDTEMVFVRDMNIVEEIYRGTAEACPKLDDQTVKLVFRNTTEIIEFHTGFLANLKEAVCNVYVPKGGRSPGLASTPGSIENESGNEVNDAKDRTTSIGPAFQANIEAMKTAHEGFLRNSDQAAKRLIQIQQDPTVKLWLNECNEVAKDLTAAWDLDSLLIKPMQRITKYPNIIITMLQHTPKDHPDRESLVQAKDVLETAIIEINKTKKNFELVGQIVGRKRKESDVKAGFARAFGKRVDKLQTANNRPIEDTVYAKLNEKFGDDYLRLQVVLRDVEFYTRQVSAYVHEFLQYLSSVELVMRIQPGSFPELESKWVQFNISIRDLEKIALEDHLAQVRKHVIEPFEQVIKAYGNPSLAMKKRQKRRLDFERSEQLRRSGKSVDAKLKENVEQYEALNDTLKKELPKLSAMTEQVGKLCLGNFVNIQVKWYSIWKDKMKTVLVDCPDVPSLQEIVASFNRDFPYAQEQIKTIGMLNPAYKGRASLSTTTSNDESLHRSRHRPSDLDTRSRGVSINGDYAPTLPTPDFARQTSGSSSFTMSPGGPMSGVPSPHQYLYRDQYSGLNSYQGSAVSPILQETGAGSSKSLAGTGATSTRPSTGRSYDSGAIPRQSSDSHQPQRDSSTTYNSNYPPQENSRYSGLFHSAMPMSDTPDDSQRASRASSRERAPADGYNVLWLAASLFEFNIATTKHEAGYPYLIYQAGEIFDVIAEKGELWLAKNQDDPRERVGWIWSKHFAKLADS